MEFFEQKVHILYFECFYVLLRTIAVVQVSGVNVWTILIGNARVAVCISLQFSITWRER